MVDMDDRRCSLCCPNACLSGGIPCPDLLPAMDYSGRWPCCGTVSCKEMTIIGLDRLEKMVDEHIKLKQDWFVKQQNMVLEETLRQFAQPPIKGELTKGKIQWRGIKLCKEGRGFGFSMWLEQRGRQIGPRIIHEYSTNLPGLEK